jgi:hypothetical protein
MKGSEHEAAFIKAFLQSGKRARFADFLAGPKRRKEMAEHLDRPLPLLPGLAWEVPGPQDFPEELEKLLHARGAGPTCQVICCVLKADGRELPLREALDLICLQPDGAILSCLPGRLAYVKPQSPWPGVILEAPGR